MARLPRGCVLAGTAQVRVVDATRPGKAVVCADVAHDSAGNVLDELDRLAVPARLLQDKLGLMPAGFSIHETVLRDMAQVSDEAIVVALLAGVAHRRRGGHAAAAAAEQIGSLVSARRRRR